MDAITAPATPWGARPGRARVVRLAGPALPYDRTYHLLGRLDKIRSLVQRTQPDVLEAHTPYLALAATDWCGRGIARAKTVFWHSDHLETYLKPIFTRWLGSPRSDRAIGRARRWLAALLAPFDAVFVAGADSARALRNAGTKNVVFVPFGVDATTFRPDARSQDRRRELAGESELVLVGVGRFAVEKRWDVVLDAFARVRDRHRASLVLYGDGPERARLERRAPPGVTFAGFEKDRPRLACALASADVLVHGCGCETFGLAVAEAVACGLPVVVPDQGGALQSAEASCSETYRTGDASACAAAIERLLARRGRDLEGRAAEAARRVPTLGQHFDQVLATYDSLLHRA